MRFSGNALFEKNRALGLAMKNCRGPLLEDGEGQMGSWRQGTNGFQWQGENKLKEVFPVPIGITIDRDGSEVAVDIKPFETRRRLSPPKGATHFRLIFSCVEILDNEQVNTEVRFSDFISCKDAMSPRITAVMPISDRSRATIMTCMAIKWLTEKDENIVELEDKRWNIAEVVDLDVFTNYKKVEKIRQQGGRQQQEASGGQLPVRRGRRSNLPVNN